MHFNIVTINFLNEIVINAFKKKGGKKKDAY